MITGKRNNQNDQSRPGVLLIIHSDGFIEIFGDRSIRLTVRHMPETRSVDGEKLAEEYIQSTLPLSVKPLYGKDKILGTAEARVVTPDDLVRTQVELSVLRQLDRLAVAK